MVARQAHNLEAVGSSPTPATICTLCRNRIGSGFFVSKKQTNIAGIEDNDYISLTDIARFKNEEDTHDVIANWLRTIDSLQFLTIWERLNNENFKPTDFEGFKSKPGENAFTISPKKWIELTNAIGIKVKSGRYGGGTFAHRDIALEFASWISAEVKLYLIKGLQRLKNQESEQLDWHGKRLLTKLNYLIHTYDKRIDYTHFFIFIY